MSLQRLLKYPDLQEVPQPYSSEGKPGWTIVTETYHECYKFEMPDNLFWWFIDKFTHGLSAIRDDCIGGPHTMKSLTHYKPHRD